MSIQQRWMWAVAIVLLDVVVVVIPVTALTLAYAVVARPPWFRQLVDDIYRNGG